MQLPQCLNGLLVSLLCFLLLLRRVVHRNLCPPCRTIGILLRPLQCRLGRGHTAVIRRTAGDKGGILRFLLAQQGFCSVQRVLQFLRIQLQYGIPRPEILPL